MKIDPQEVIAFEIQPIPHDLYKIYATFPVHRAILTLLRGIMEPSGKRARI